jgi:serine/threonine protein kinase
MERTTTEFWTSCEGQFANSYPLQNRLGESGSAAVYATAYGEDAQPAAIKLVQLDGPDREQQLNTWSEASRLSHPGLVRILDSGRCEIQGVPLLYVVMERADGNLAEVLTERPLTAEEAREMLSCAAAALSYLHVNGFVHGRVKATNIMAVGEQIKLTTDSVVRANAGNAADDVKSLGLTLVQALTQHTPNADTLPQPFQEIAEHCLQPDVHSRWAASQIVSYLQDPVAPPPLIPPPPASQRSHLQLYSIVAAMIVITAIVLLLRSAQSPPPAPPAQPTVNQAPVAPAPAESAPPVTTEQSESRQTRTSPAKPSGTWYVVSATYTRKADAERRARSISSKWPRFKADIYSPPGDDESPYYLVTIGSNLSQKAAVEVQQRAIAAGLPGDTYIQQVSAAKR